MTWYTTLTVSSHASNTHKQWSHTKITTPKTDVMKRTEKNTFPQSKDRPEWRKTVKRNSDLCGLWLLCTKHGWYGALLDTLCELYMIFNMMTIIEIIEKWSFVSGFLFNFFFHDSVVGHFFFIYFCSQWFFFSFRCFVCIISFWKKNAGFYLFSVEFFVCIFHSAHRVIETLIWFYQSMLYTAHSDSDECGLIGLTQRFHGNPDKFGKFTKTITK